MKLGRNERCYCGSGKKYKRCCLAIDEKLGLLTPVAKLTQFVTYEFVDQMSTVEIEQRLKRSGIPFDREQFVADIEKFASAQDLSEHWFRKYSLELDGPEEDFPFVAAWVLWDRLGIEEYLSREKMSEMYRKGFELGDKNDPVGAVNLWLEVWEGIKRWYRPELKDIKDLNEPFELEFFVSNFCQDLMVFLDHAGAQDKTFYEKQIAYCTEFCKLFPSSSELIIQNMRYAIADSYYKLGKIEEAEKCYKKTVEEFPENTWSYIRLGDFYYLDGQGSLEEALHCYEKAIQLTDDNMDIETVQERLEQLKEEIENK